MLKWMLVLFMMFSVSLKAETKVLAFSGSSRDGSVNQKLVTEAAQIASKMGATVTLVDLKDYQLPFYNADLESSQGMPEIAKKFRRLMVQSDIILIASPEYNGSLPGELKNAIDWASRGENGGSSREAFKGKTFVVMSASPGQGGGARGLVHLTQIIGNVGGTVLPNQVVVPNAFGAFDEQGKLKDPTLVQKLNDAITAALSSTKQAA